MPIIKLDTLQCCNCHKGGIDINCIKDCPHACYILKQKDHKTQWYNSVDKSLKIRGIVS